MPTVFSEEIPLNDHYAVFRMDNGGLKVRKVRGKLTSTFVSSATGRTVIQTFHTVEEHNASSILAERGSNFVTVMEIDPITRPRGEYISWLQRQVRTRLNEWVV